MAEPTIIPLQRISVFMPHRLTDMEMRLLFVARKPLFERIMQRIGQEKSKSIPQHYLLVGVRGMGKTMLLRRLAVELSDEKYRNRFVGLSFPEEQYNIDRLSKFWLNALDALANTLQKEGDEAAADLLDKEIAQLETIKIEEQKSNSSYQLLADRCQTLGRRPVFLLDNLNLIFDRLSEVEHSKIRALITSNNAPIFVGASADLVKDDYQAPFYDAFDVEYLPKLDFKQTLSLIEYLAEVTDQRDFKTHLYQNLPRLEALHQLTGGNVRTLILLFRLVVKDFSGSEIYQDLEALVDDMTPIYKAQFEEFSPQTQLVLDAIALLWDPCSLDGIREFTNLETGKISAHLDRLQKAGWIQKLGSRKKSTYEISERFFNVWYLMRRGSRRQGRDLQWLTQFLQGWFNKKELRQMLKYQADNLDDLGEKDLAYYLPMSRALGKTKKGKQYQEQFYKRLIEICDGDEQKVKDCMGVKLEEINDAWFDEHKIAKQHRLMIEAFRNWDEAFRARISKNWEKAEELYKIALPNFLHPEIIWHNLGNIYTDSERYQDAEQAYRNSIKIDSKSKLSWYGLGFLLSKLNRYEEAELAFRSMIEFAPKYSQSWNGLGSVLEKSGRYQEAEEAYLNSIQFDSKNLYPLDRLGNLYQILGRYKEAEEIFRNIIKIEPNDISPWIKLGNIYLDYLANYEEAKTVYLKAIELDENSIFPKANLVFLYRDKLNDFSKALQLFKETESMYIKSKVKDTAYLHRAIFALHNKNWGTSVDFWKEALEQIENKLPEHTKDDWQRSAAVAVKLGYGKNLMELLEETGHSRIFRPFYEAIKALTLNDEDYLRTQVAAEVREVALAMYAYMKKYNEV
jgi:tetratricopeptide (TPR) repeat protein